MRRSFPGTRSTPFDFALLYGTRKGQLARTLRRFVDLDGGVIEWPKSECKARKPHKLPLEGEGFAIVERAMANARPWCPYLFHGRDCAPGRKPESMSKRYGCLGNLRVAFQKACRGAGIPSGRASGGVVFHSTRSTCATNLRAAGLGEDDCMRVGGWRTREVFQRYNLTDVDQLRERLAAARTQATVVRLADKRKAKRAKG
ncbi:MAG: hypothetical protein E6J60_05325 [Deltaproteobacteria bacterium]|nr:MAG: hypothetical protein E6J60_05325 [Deltaproteobacteria bacterium]